MSRLAAACVVSFFALCAATATAADEPRTEAAGARIVHLYVSGSSGAVAKTAATVRELCSRLNIDVVAEATADETVLENAESNAWIKAYVDLRAPLTPRIVVVEAATRRELERRSLPASSSLEMSVEESAHVLYVAAESALAARDAHTAGPQNAAPAPPPGTPPSAGGTPAAPASTSSPPVTKEKEAPPESGSRPEAEGKPPRAAEESYRARAERKRAPTSAAFRTGAAVYGAVAAFDPSHMLAGFGGSLDAGLTSGALRISALASVSAFLPSEVIQDGASATLHAEGARLSAVAGWRVTPAFSPFLSVGGGADRVTVNPNPPPGAWGAGAESRVDPMIEVLLGARLGFTSALGAFFALGADTDLAPHRYVIEANGAPQTFFELARVRPTAMLGLSILLSGAQNGARAPDGTTP